MTFSLTIFHTNDFHARLTPEKARWIRQRIQQEEGPRIVLDAGDAVASGNVTFNPRGEAVYELMNEIGYDAMTIGNREFHFSRVGFECKLKGANFPHLCANIRWSSTEANPSNLPVKPYIMLEPAKGIKVGVIGVTIPMITERMLSRKVSSYVFDPPIPAARLAIAALESTAKPDFLIALTHIGFSRDQDFADSLPEFMVIVGGHSHTEIPQGYRQGDVSIVQTGSYANNLGVIRMETDAGGVWKVISMALERIGEA